MELHIVTAGDYRAHHIGDSFDPPHQRRHRIDGKDAFEPVGIEHIHLMKMPTAPAGVPQAIERAKFSACVPGPSAPGRRNAYSVSIVR